MIPENAIPMQKDDPTQLTDFLFTIYQTVVGYLINFVLYE